MVGNRPEMAGLHDLQGMAIKGKTRVSTVSAEIDLYGFANCREMAAG